MAKVIVWDSNVFAKLLFEEHDSGQARAFITACFENGAVRIIVPELFTYELASITQYYQSDMARTISALDAPFASSLVSISPDREAWLLAEKIAKAGHEKSGFPSIYDSVYHALAIRNNGVFVTADKKHFAKSTGFKHICLLENWHTIFQD